MLQAPTAPQKNVTVENSGSAVALMVHLQLFDKTTDQRILPAFYGDNYLNLLPGTKREVTIEIPVQAGTSHDFAIRVDGWNLDPAAKFGGSRDVPVIVNSNAMAVGKEGGVWNTCAN